jgi:hypothetical protein
MPAVVTLDDLAAIIAADEHGIRYETSTEGALSLVPPPDSAHAEIATQLMAWFIAAGVPLPQIMQVRASTRSSPQHGIKLLRVGDRTVAHETPAHVRC